MNIFRSPGLATDPAAIIMNQLHNLRPLETVPLQAGHMPPTYRGMPPTFRDHLAGGRLVALSKRPITGIRVMNITDAWRRITAKGLLQNCLRDYDPRVFDPQLQHQIEHSTCSTS